MTAKKRTILITGACGDIGQSLAAEFAQSGAQLALCDLHPLKEAKALFAKLPKKTKVFYQPVDVTDSKSTEQFVTKAIHELGALDICIVNAGIVERGALLDLSPEAWRRTLDVNLTGAFFTAQAAARQMVRAGRGGQIIFISSWVQDVPRATIGAYSASKGGMKMLAKTLAVELGPKGIRVNLVAPGFVDAGLTGRNLESHPERRAQIENEIPLGKLISGPQLARSIVSLCSEDNSYITGATFLIDGGSSLLFRK